MSDLSRPNHYAQDALGDPYACIGDHNHPYDWNVEDAAERRAALDAAAEEAAERAVCARCGVRILGDPSREGVVFGRVMVPMIRLKEAFQLCGRCGLKLREFLTPEVLDNDDYIGKRNQLLGPWS